MIDRILSIPNLLAFWHFQDGLTSVGAHAYTLQPMTRSYRYWDDGVFGRGLYLPRGAWFRIPRADCPALNIHGVGAQVTAAAWVKRMPQPPTYDCETLLGVWDESRKKRQYALFLDLPIWDSKDQVGGHVSSHGGPTPNYKYCMDAAIGQTPVEFGVWTFAAFTYDGQTVRAYHNGRFDEREGRNPFDYPQGLFDGGDDGADFTVGAVSRSGEPGNFFHGVLGGLAVFNRALTDDELQSMANAIEK